jgi:chromobox protein 1
MPSTRVPFSHCFHNREATEVLQEYFAGVGGRQAILDQTEKAKAKKRGRTGSDQPAGTKRQRKNGVHPADTEPPATKKKWQPPSGSWEDDIENIDACEEEGGGKLVVYLNWKNGQKTKHETSVIYKKCPQKVSRGYTLNLFMWGLRLTLSRCFNSTNDM